MSVILDKDEIKIITEKVSENDVILCKIDTDKCGLDGASKLMKRVKESFPNNIVLGLPLYVDCNILPKKQAIKMLKKMAGLETESKN